MITPTINYDYSRIDGIFKHFEVDNQLFKLYEELSELKFEISKLNTFKQDYLTKQNFAEELADVLVMCLQFYHSSSEFREKIDKAMLEKQIRTLNRIEEKYYEKGNTN